MLVKIGDAKRFLLFLGPAIFLLFLAFSFLYDFSVRGWVERIRTSPPTSPSPKTGSTAIPTPDTHHELSSVSTPDGRYFKIDFGADKTGAINPNIIPHPVLDGVWVMVAQEAATLKTDFYEIACYASFHNDSVLRCDDAAFRLPYVPTKTKNKGDCKGKFSLLELNEGPHDARVFYGPESAYTTYGSNSAHTCFGQWIQDFPSLMQWGPDVVPTGGPFATGTEIQRPKPYGMIEKNWFVFWDDKGQIHAHYDLVPKRIFSQLGVDGSASQDLAPAAAKGDEKCLKRYLPALARKHESIHQATNSLSITMCNRTDPECLPSEANTFVFTIFHKKTFEDYHSVYEPYAMVFSQRAPFELYGIGQKPLWIKGRGMSKKEGQTEMFYVVSISWKSRTQKYHGYLDDDIFLGLGYEDQDTAGIDVKAGDVLANLGRCVDA
jgi:hypothetical protein